jgi:hypothetical protein
VRAKQTGWSISVIRPTLNLETALFLTDMGDREARIGFQIQANGVHYFLTDLKLNPHETRAIDIRKLRDAQKPDFNKNVIPAMAVYCGCESITSR